MSEAILDTVAADIESAGYLFRATGHRVAFPGYTAVYEESSDDVKEEEKKTTAGKPLPTFAEGDTVTCEKLEPAQHFTQPPARYTEASLIKAMEEKGIGRPSTYAPTISTILDRDYVDKEGRSLKPTALGEGVTELLVDKFTSVADLRFTAKMEEELDEVEQGKIGYIEVLHRFYDDFSAALQKAETDMEGQRVQIRAEETEEICENCGSKMVIKFGRFGKFLACPNYPECKFTKPIVEDTGVECPLCGARVVKKKSKRGYGYLGCEKNPTCSFMTWDKTTKERCPDCGGPIFRHYDRETGETTMVCYKEGCGYSKFVSKRTPRKKKTETAAAEGEAQSTDTAETKKTAAKKTAAKKTTAKKTTAKKTAAKKTTAKKTTAKKTTAKKTTRKKAVTEETADEA